MKRWFNNTFLTPRFPYENTFEHHRASWLLAMLWIIVVAWLAWFIFGIVPQLQQGNAVPLQTIATFVITLIAVPVIFRWIHRGQLSYAAFVFVGLLITYTIPILSAGLNSSGVAIILVPLIAASTLLNKRGMLGTTGLLILLASIAAIRQTQLTAAETIVPADTVGTDFSLILIVLIGSLGFLYVAVGNIDIIARSALRNERFLRSVGRFNTQETQTGELGQLDQEVVVLARSLNIVHNDFGYIFAQIYLVDGRGTITRRVRTGLGERQSAITEEIEDDRLPIVNEAIQAREPILVTPYDTESRRDYFLPSVRYGALIPMIYRGQVVGVLDLQSVSEDGFASDELAALQLLMNQTATSMMQARMITELRQRLLEQEENAMSLQTQLYDLERRGVAPGTSWATYLEGRGKTALGFDTSPDNAEITLAHDLPDHLRPALERGEVIIEQHDDRQIMNIPIRLRDQILGAMAFTINNTRPITEQQLDLANRVAERLALALENARLFEQSRSQALREQKASEVTSMLIRATDVDTVMQLAAESFNEALGAIYTRIHIEPNALDTTTSDDDAPPQAASIETESEQMS